MAWVNIICWLMFILMAVGCGSDSLSTANPGVSAPHDGTLVFLAKNEGFVEIVKKEGPAPITAEVTFYFYKDVNTPFEPESGTLLIGKTQKVALESDGEGLVTPTGPILFGKRDVEGLLSVQLDGESKQIPLGLRE